MELRYNNREEEDYNANGVISFWLAVLLKMQKYHTVKNIKFDHNYICLIVDGKDYQIDLKNHSRKLLKSAETIRNTYVIAPSGYGIHWPEIDEDLAIDSLIKTTHKYGMPN